MPTVKNVGEPCAREPHARFEVAAGGNQASRLRRAAPAPLADPTTLQSQPDRLRSSWMKNAVLIEQGGVRVAWRSEP